MSVSLLVVDDDDDYRLLVRLAVAAHPRLEVVGEAATTEQAMALVDQLRPDVVLLDLTLRDPDGRPPLSALAAVSPQTGFISTSAYGGDPAASLPPGRHLGHLSKAVPPSLLASEIVLLVEMMEAATHTLDTATASFPCEKASAAQARRFVEQVLDRWGCNGVTDTVKLLVSELVGNAVAHASSDVEVAMELHPGAVRVAVGDDDTEVLRRRAAGELDMSGRGIAILETLAEAWGMTRRPSGKAVWFEVTRSTNGMGG